MGLGIHSNERNFRKIKAALVLVGLLVVLDSSAYGQGISVSPSSVTGGSYATFTVTTNPPPGFGGYLCETSTTCGIFGYWSYGYGVIWDEPTPGTLTGTTFVQAVAQPMTINFVTGEGSASAPVTVFPPPPFVMTADNTTIVGDGSTSPAAHVTLSTQGLFDPWPGIGFYTTGSNPCLLSVFGPNTFSQSDPCNLIVVPGMGVFLGSTGAFAGPPAPLSIESWHVYAGTVTQPTDVSLTLAYQICVTHSESVTGRCYPDDGYLAASVVFHLVPPPASDLGPCNECEAVAGQPVNLSTGDVWVSKADYSVPGLAGGLSLTRTWNSLWSQTTPPFSAGMFGIGWTSDFEERLQVLANSNVKYWRGTGNTWTFHPITCSGCASSLITPPNQHATISLNSTTNLYTITFADGATKTFNSSGYLTALKDRNGNISNITYDASNRITNITSPGGQSLTFTYGLAQDPNRVTAIRDAVGTVATYSYSNSLLTNATYADGGQNNYSYDAANNITSVTDDQGKVLETHTYDSSGRGLTSARANGVDSVTIQYGSNGSTTLTDSMNRTTAYSYSTISGSNYITGIQGPGCDSCGGRNNQSFTQDASGNRLSSTDPNGNNVSYTYDGSGNVLTRTDAAGTWTYTYNGLSEVLTAKDPLGNTTTNTYDTKGNLLTTTTPSPDGGNTAGSKTTFTYDAKGQLLTISDPLTHKTTIAYFPSGLIQTITNAQSNTTNYTYDGRGNRLTVKDALSKITTFTYDGMNRLTKITYPDNSATQFAYDKRGRRTSVTDANNKTTTYAYDDADRLTTVTDAATNPTQYAYDTESNLTSITDALNRTTTFTYDFLGRVTKTLFPSNLFETYAYDNNGNLASKTDRNSHTITYTFDQLNRLAQKSYPDSTSVTYTYDNDSRLTQVLDPTGTYQITFDHMGRLTGATTSYAFLTGRNFTTSYSYDAASNRTGFTDPEGGATGYVYDTLNRLQTLTPPTAFVRGSFGYTYDVLSRRTQLTRPNKVNTTYSYDSLSRLLSATHATSKATLDGASYTVDAAGNRTSRTPLPSGTATNYAYDPIYELSTATQGSTTKESYSYDATGNRLSALGSSGWAYNSSNELSSRPGVTYTYDNNGNVLTKVDSTGTTTYAWDFENRLTSVNLPGSGGTVTFKYDPFGRRIYKSSSSGTGIYAYDGDNLIEETNSSGAAVARYAQSLNIDEPLAMLRSSTTSYYHADGLGSTTSLTNSSAATAATYTYDSFGILTASTGSLTNPFRYTGREFDPETNLYFYRARYFDPSNSRFLSEDPSGFSGGVNAYLYTGNNPVASVDPYGLDWIEYTGQRLTVYSGNFGDRSGILEQCKATSGLPDRQSPAFQGIEAGPVPAGLYKINLQLNPSRFASLAADGSNLYSNFGVQRIRDHYRLPDGNSVIPAGWGTWRARLEKVKVNSKRDNFYLHNSTKGYTHGCVETCDDLYDRFSKYHQQGLGSILVNIRYTTESTNGGTRQ